MTSISINKTYLDICLAVYGIQPNVDNTNVIDRNIWEQLTVNVIQGDGTSIYTTNDLNGNPYYNTSSGVQAALYRNRLTNEMVIAYRGTDQTEDLLVDLQIALGNISQEQLLDAENFYNAVITQYGDSNITITGHSLGGALAQLVGAETGVETVTFNAPGMKNQISGGSYNNITNYVNLNDWIGCYGQHAGTTCFYLPLKLSVKYQTVVKYRYSLNLEPKIKLPVKVRK